jgi:hypothetical protein
MTKNVTKLAWWWWGSFLKNTTNQGDRARGVVVLGVSLDCVASEVLYLRWFLCGELTSDGPAETVMVGECWRGDVMFFCMVRTCKKMSRVRTTLKLVPVWFGQHTSSRLYIVGPQNKIISETSRSSRPFLPWITHPLRPRGTSFYKLSTPPLTKISIHFTGYIVSG